MGYELMRFISEVDEEFYCSICTMVLEDPVQSPCDHLFCSECVKLWLATDRSCPIDRSLLKLDMLKHPARFFRNMLDKLEIKCDFQGCQVVVKLEYLPDHLTTCKYSPNSEIFCDKGCHMKVSRREYEDNNCLTHLSLRYEEKITKLIDDLNIQQDQNTKLKDEVTRQREQITKLMDEVNRQHEQIIKFNSEARTSQKWQHNHNMKVSTTDKQNILAIDDNSRNAWIQSWYSLEPANYCFKVQILKVGGVISIGVCRNTNHPTIHHPISYHSDGQLLLYGKFEPVESAWKDGDVIECGIKFPQNFNNDRDNNVAVYFLKNAQFMIEKRVQITVEGVLPTVWMTGAGTRTKVKYLTN